LSQAPRPLLPCSCFAPPAPAGFYSLSLHDALPIWIPLLVGGTMLYFKALLEGLSPLPSADPEVRARIEQQAAEQGWESLHRQLRSEEHTSELQSRFDLVCRLLLEKKKNEPSRAQAT